MVFSSIFFLFYFLPVTLAGYYLLPARWRNGFLLAASLFFYGFGEPRYLPLLLASILVNFFFGLQIGRREGAARRRWMWAAVGLDLAALAVFKYSGFLAEILHLEFSTPALPLGISFYTFQIVSYILDVYRKEVPAQRNPAKLALYSAMFPQLVAGPIVRYSDVAAQIDSRKTTVSLASSGVARFIVGLFKKLVFANAFGVVASHAFSQTAPALTMGTAWLGALAYGLQIYFDFSAYSDMAIGLGRMLGFRFRENFDHPYMAGSVTEFWRRWHISLSGWFRDYVYLPLGGSRRSKYRNLFNLLLVWLLTGLWHGAAWNFVLWGVYYGVLLTAERALRRSGVRLPAALRHGGTLLAVLLGWVLFRVDSLPQLGFYLRAMFRWSGPLWDANTLLYLHDYGALAVLAVLACTPLPDRILSWLEAKERWLPQAAYWAAIYALLFCGVLCLVNASYNPFIYFRF